MKIFWEVLSEQQTAILPYLSLLKEKNFYLAGGTALALQIKHCTSLDFDFYTEEEFLPEDIIELFRKGTREIIELTQKKYPPFNPYLALQALTYFEDAEKENFSERKIVFFKPLSWDKVKEFFVEEVRGFKKKLG